MDVTQQKYRKTINLYKQPLNNLISEYPINDREPPDVRNLKYIIQKESISMSLPYDDDKYDSVFDDIKHNITNQNIQQRIFSIRLARALPFYYRIKVIQECQNQIIKLATSSHAKADSPSKMQTKQKAILIKQSSYQFSYQILSDVIDLLLSVYQLSYLSEEIYFDVNQRILTIFGRIIQSGYLSQQKQMLRNAYECIRAIFIVFGPKNQSQQGQQNKIKLINRIITYFSPNNSFISKTQNISNISNSQIISQKSYSSKFYHLILKTKEFEARIRSRFLFGLSCLLSYNTQTPQEITDLLIKEIFIVLQNANECDVNLECFNAIKSLLKSNINFYTRNCLIKEWTSILSQISYKKQYLQYFIGLLNEASSFKNECPLKVKFYVGMSFLQITKNIPQQFSRFIIYKLACRNIMSVSKVLSSKGHNSMIILNIFQYSWFLDRVKQQNDLFRSQFLICLLQSFFAVNQNCSKSQVVDLISLCHILLDWKCSSKQDTHIPTIKFAFDMYLKFLKIASEVLGEQIQRTIQQLIEKCNDAQNIYFLFKLKLISMIVSLPWYQKNAKFLSEIKLNFNYLNEQIRISIMPKNPKPIFDFAYSQSADGLVQSRKEIEFVKVIMDLLNNLQKSHEQMNEMIEQLMIDYHAFLNELQMAPHSNKDLIYCLQTGTADQYFSLCQRNFLLGLIDEIDPKGNNFELNLDNNILYSPYQTFESQDEINIFGPMSPIQLTIRFHLHNSYSSIYLEIKKNNWVSCPKLKLIISSGMEKKELTFESSIIEIKIDRVGGLHFQVWTAQGNELLIGSGNLKIKRKLQWRKVNYLSFIDGIKRKSYFKKSQNNNQECECYLSYYYGEPLLIQIFRNHNQVVFGVSNKQIWNQLQSCLHDIIQEFTDESAIIFQ